MADLFDWLAPRARQWNVRLLLSWVTKVLKYFLLIYNASVLDVRANDELIYCCVVTNGNSERERESLQIFPWQW